MTDDAIRVDYALAMDDGSGCGLTNAQLEAEAPAFERGLRRVLAEAEGGRLGFWGLPDDTIDLEKVQAFASELSDAVTDIVVLGIGGSSLGGRALVEALGPAVAPPDARRIHYPDNSDPWRLDGLLRALDPKATLAVVISKSGGTVETAAQLLVVRQWFRDGGVAMKDHLVAITDPESGLLRSLADTEGLRSFDIPSNVGGRFSVLTPVGLLPGALAGFDMAGLLKGAGAMRDRCARTVLKENPAGIVAALHVLHHRLHGRPIHVMMPYSDALRGYANWFVQLWAESLGKRLDRQERVVETGPTPLPAVGATDQHAQVQLFMEGPKDKLVTFVALDQPLAKRAIPTEEGPYAYLGGHDLAELLDYERRATALALAGDGRPSLTIHLPRLDAPALGGLFFLMEAATAIAGELYGIDAFDQPGVELGKRLAYGLLGRKGYEDAASEVQELERTLPRHRV
ncbi:MAG: glucose-6-phosphate isomerase [Deltaproteobacteria bacterium]|nr:glucose-6-phosphate isomerase [Deltaproteobacteria bacterium]